MRIVIAGAGAWGTALATRAADAGHQVLLWARDATQARELERSRENVRYLPGIALPRGLSIDSSSAPELAALAASAELVALATPVAALRTMLELLRDVTVPTAWLCKGFERPRPDAPAHTGLMPHEVQQQVAPQLAAGAFSGPSFAQEVALGLPAAIVAASPDARVRAALVSAFHGPALRVYQNDDVVGVEVGGAVKNVLAIATGLADGLQLGLNARAALITRGLAEMSRLGVALGARNETFMGLSGVGDLVLTATGDLSRNRRVGLLLAEGKSLADAVDSLGHVAEGVHSAHVVLQRARQLDVELPIIACTVALLDGKLTPHEAVATLMQRAPTDELHRG